MTAIAACALVRQADDSGFKVKRKKTEASLIAPMLLLRSESLPEGPNWIYELKLDGYRVIAIKTGRKSFSSLARRQ